VIPSVSEPAAQAYDNSSICFAEVTGYMLDNIHMGDGGGFYDHIQTSHLF